MFENFLVIAQTKPSTMEMLPQMIIPIGLMFVVFYFIVMRPQAKQREAQAKLLAGMTVGDEVVTVGGIIGTIKSIDDKIMTLEISKGTKIKILRNRIKGTKTKVLNTGAEKSA